MDRGLAHTPAGIEPDLRARVLAACERALPAGGEIYGTQMRGGGSSLRLTVFLDRDAGADSFDAEAVADYSRRLQAELEADLPQFASGLSLEVSTPGIERELRKLGHFQRYVGKLARLEWVAAAETRRAMVKLLAVEGETIVGEAYVPKGERRGKSAKRTAGETYRIPYADVRHARLFIDF